jgi:c-di-GMP-binding flagellar brake protein YcgR
MHGLLRYMMPVSVREGDGNPWYPSLVLDFREGEEIVIGVPMARGEEIPVEAGTRLQIQTMHRDGVRRFTTAVVRRRHVPSPCLYLTWPDEVQRIQRREHVRVEVTVPITARVANTENELQVLNGHTVDVSAGGVKFNLVSALTAGSVVELELSLPGNRMLACGARVVRSGESESAKGPKRYWAAAQFMGLTGAAQKDLTKFVFDAQRELIRKGLA